MEQSTLIDKISYIRTRAGLSARALSLSIGKTASYIAVLEQQKKFAPSFETLCDILDACNTTLEEFFYYDITAYKTDKEIINLLKNTSDDKKTAALSVLKIR